MGYYRRFLNFLSNFNCINTNGFQNYKDSYECNDDILSKSIHKDIEEQDIQFNDLDERLPSVTDENDENIQPLETVAQSKITKESIIEHYECEEFGEFKEYQDFDIEKYSYNYRNVSEDVEDEDDLCFNEIVPNKDIYNYVYHHGDQYDTSDDEYDVTITNNDNKNKKCIIDDFNENF